MPLLATMECQIVTQLWIYLHDKYGKICFNNVIATFCLFWVKNTFQLHIRSRASGMPPNGIPLVPEEANPLNRLHYLAIASTTLMAIFSRAEARSDSKEVIFHRPDGVECKVTLSIEVLTGPPTIWGAEGVRPATLASGLRAHCKDGAVSVPREAFFDLGNPLRLAVQMVDQGYDIIIDGAQGPLAYVARLHVRGHAIVARDVASVSIPGVVEHVNYREEES